VPSSVSFTHENVAYVKKISKISKKSKKSRKFLLIMYVKEKFVISLNIQRDKLKEILLL